MKRVLMLAFHFPPLAGSSGIQRTLGFARHLPEFGWQPLILTATPGAYEQPATTLTKDRESGDLSPVVHRQRSAPRLPRNGAAEAR